MADISKIQLPNGTTYDLKDKTSGYITNAQLPVYTLSMSSNVITLSGNGSTSSITLPVYDGTVEINANGVNV